MASMAPVARTARMRCSRPRARGAQGQARAGRLQRERAVRATQPPPQPSPSEERRCRALAAGVLALGLLSAPLSRAEICTLAGECRPGVEPPTSPFIKGRPPSFPA